MPEDLSWLYAPFPPSPVVREIPLMWPSKDGPWRIRVLLDRGAGRDWPRYEWKDGEKLGKQELEEVARMLVDHSDGCAGV